MHVGCYCLVPVCFLIALYLPKLLNPEKKLCMWLQITTFFRLSRFYFGGEGEGWGADVRLKYSVLFWFWLCDSLLSISEYCVFVLQPFADDVKVILNEGMPHHKNPFDKGRLIINFKVGIDGHLHRHLSIDSLNTLLSGQIPLSWISQWQEAEGASQTVTFSRRRTNAHQWLLWRGKFHTFDATDTSSCSCTVQPMYSISGLNFVCAYSIASMQGHVHYKLTESVGLYSVTCVYVRASYSYYITNLWATIRKAGTMHWQ